MTAFVVKDMGGEIPRRDPRLLPDNMAEVSINCDLTSGPLDGLPQPEFIIDLSAAAFPVRKAYRFPGPVPGVDADLWLPLPSEFSSVVRSPLANDTLHRIYWTNPANQPVPGAFWNTYARIRDGLPAYNMGFIAVDPGITPSVVVTGGTLTIPAVARSYVFTYVDQYGEESAPSNPSPVVDGPSDGTWVLSGIPATAPTSPGGKNYPTVNHWRVYRTISGTTTQFFMVGESGFGPSTFTDTLPDTTIVNNNVLETTSWASPPEGLDGLVGMAGGMLVGFTGNTVHFAEVNRPHAWPAGYDLSLQYPIVGLAVWQQSLVVLTTGFPSTGQGNSPAQFSFQQVQAPEPCISRGSILTDLMGVYYASQNGLIMLNYYGMQNQTLSNLTKNIWLTEYQAEHIVACRHRAQYLAINGTGKGFVIDYTETRMGITHVAPFVDVISIWNDVYTGDAYMVAAGKVYRWDSPTTPSLTYRWRSKSFYLSAPTNFGAVQISSGPEIALPAPAPALPCPATHDPTLDLPAGVNAVFRMYAGPNAARLVHEQHLIEPREVFRLPGGQRVFNWQFELVSRVPIHSIEIASTMRELKGV